jgi:hypothetical protein
MIDSWLGANEQAQSRRVIGRIRFFIVGLRFIDNNRAGLSTVKLIQPARHQLKTLPKYGFCYIGTMETFSLICSSLACRISGSRSVQVQAVNLAEALAKHSRCLKCGAGMKGKDVKREKRG